MTPTQAAIHERHKRFHAAVAARAAKRAEVMDKGPPREAVRPFEPTPVVIHPERAPIVRDWLFVDGPKTMSITNIKKTVCAAFGLRVSHIDSEHRVPYTVLARHVSIWLCRQLTPHPFPYISRNHGRRNHSTAVYAFKRIEALRGSDPEIKTITDELLAKLEGEFRG